MKLNGWTVLHEAVAKNAPIRIVERLIVQGDLDVNTQDVQLLNTPLHYAAIHNVSPSLVQLLLSHRADPLSKAIVRDNCVEYFIPSKLTRVLRGA